MKGKTTDSNSSVYKGGRADRYWSSRKKGSTVHGKTSQSKTYTENNADALKLQQEFRIKGFEFGNWVSQPERIDYIIASDSALDTLSSILHTKNIGMDEMIGIAFGARGYGRSLAHYEPELNMINLTRTGGDQSLAHEYGHAIDYNFGRFVDQNRHHAALSGGRFTAGVIVNNGGQFRYYVNMIVDYIKTTKSHSDMCKKLTGEYWRRRTEVFARWFEQYCAYKKFNPFLSKPLMAYYTGTPYLRKEDFMETVQWGDKLCIEIGKYLDRKSTRIIPMTTPKEKKAASTGAVTKKKTSRNRH